MAAVAVGAPAPGWTAPGGVPGAPSVPGANGHGHASGRGLGPVGSGGSSPGGTIGNGLAGGVGGPTGGLGASRGQRGGGGGGGGGGGAAISPLSPNAASMATAGPGPGFSVGHGHGNGSHGIGNGGGISALSPAAMGDGGPGRALGVGRGRGVGRGGGSDLPPGLLQKAQPGNGFGRDGRPVRNGLQKVDDKVDGVHDKAAKGKANGLAKQATGGDQDDDAAITALTGARRIQARALIEAHRDVVEPDDLGRPVVRGEILALAPSAAALARAQRAGFLIRRRDSLPGLGVETVVLRGPRNLSAVQALRRLQAMDPAGRFDFNHLYQESGVVAGRAAPPVRSAAAPATASGVRIGLVDGGVASGQPALAGARIVQRGFAGAGPAPSPHATAVASLMAGRMGAFRGAAPGATLYVADVYGRTATGGSAETIARALAWLAEARAPVINISLVGPPNLLLEAAVKALIAKGHVVVAAVGNDGPAAPPLYPASYPGVIAVTAVDARRRLLPEASRATHVDFAAPGAEMAAAGTDGGFVAVRGTSFAAPLAAGLLARRMTAPDRAAADRAIVALGRQALDAGPKGRDPQFGRGVVATELRTPPPEVGARLALNGP